MGLFYDSTYLLVILAALDFHGGIRRMNTISANIRPSARTAA